MEIGRTNSQTWQCGMHVMLNVDMNLSMVREGLQISTSVTELLLLLVWLWGAQCSSAEKSAAWMDS